ncbi:MAG: phage tail tape measure protein, partial [Hungatella sp.]|nr:phage tail tape measure protein [Hungatella sp.]
MANKEYELAIKIAGMIDQSLNESCNLTKKQLRAVAKEAAAASKESVSFADAMGNAGSGIDGLWNGATKAVKTTAEALLAAGAAAGVAGGLIIHVGSDFESAFAGVKKTVDATDQQLADLEEGLREMAKNKPQTAVELAEIAEAAGQLGIHTENIEDFTNVMADLKVATNLGDEGASQFAKFANITNMSQDKFDRLGSSVVDLGNHMATTESDIVGMAMRLAGAGTQVKMNEADIMGFAAALSSVGIEAEMGGSAMSKMMIEMQLAVETGLDAWGPLEDALSKTGHTTAQAEIAVEKGGNALKNFAAATGQNSKQLRESVKAAQKSAGSLQDFADVANMTSEEFAAAFKDNAAKAMGAFISGLNDTERLGQSAIVTLESMDIKEVRLRDTLLRAANASGLFNESIDMANRAFEENTALTKEADQRYATFESRLDMVKNRVTDMGITLYQDFRDPLSDVLDVALEFTEEADLFDPAYIDGVAKNFQKSIPTVIRQIGDAKDAVVDFAGPFIELGDWMIENPDVIAGTLVGIGTTIATLKLAQTVNNVTTSIKGLYIAMASNPITAAIGLVALAGGAIVGIATQVDIANKRLKKQDLAKHFGNISLSMEDLDQAAKQILGMENRKNFELFTEQLNEMDTITRKLEQHQQTFGKLNWKIGMGIELTKADRENYTAAIDGYIETSIAAIEQQHYTANVAVQTLFKGNGGEELSSSFDQFYLSAQADISAAGKRLGDAYHDAMQDGIVSPIEQETIERLTRELQQIQERVMESDRLAEWDVMATDYFNGGKLDAESFLNLQGKIDDKVKEDMSIYREAYKTTLATNDRILDSQLNNPNATEFNKKVAQQEYDAANLAAEEQYKDRRIETSERAMKFTTDTLTTQYPEVMGQLNEFPEFIGDYLNQSMINNADEWVSGSSIPFQIALDAIKNSPEISQASKDAMKEILDGLSPQVEDMEALAASYEAQGKPITEGIRKGLNNIELMKALVGDEGAIMNLLDEYLTSSPEALALFSSAEGAGGWVAGSMGNGIEKNSYKATNAAEKVADDVDGILRSRFGNMTVYGEVEV